MSVLNSLWSWIFHSQEDITFDDQQTNMAVATVNSADEMLKLINDAGSSVVVAHFWADWAPQCKQVDDVMSELAKRYLGLKFTRVEAEAVPELSEKFSVTVVPTVVLLKKGNLLDRVEGANVPELAKKIEGCLSDSSTSSPAATGGGESTISNLNAKLQALIHAAPVMLFMKGTADEPRCGFSRTMVDILRQHELEFSVFNILADEEVRQGLKKYSDWPTYPQLYVDGELIGGLDIVKELAASGELKDMMPKAKTEGELNAKLKKLVNRSPIILFMKGTPDAPRCGFSNTIVQILREHGIEFDYYDILGDEEVRQGLKKFSDWPTYPQLYSQGNLIGGLDIVKELVETDALREELGINHK
eukprot:gene552-3869_t